MVEVARGLSLHRDTLSSRARLMIALLVAVTGIITVAALGYIDHHEDENTASEWTQWFQ